MTDLWLGAAALLLVAAVMMLWPLRRRQRMDRVDRTALNVAL